MKTLIYLGLCLAFTLSSCYKAKKEYLSTAITQYSDGFESYTNESQLYSNLTWNGNLLTDVNNSILIDTTITHSGLQSLHCHALTTQGGTVSKASVLKNKFGYKNKSVIVFSAWYYIDANKLDNLFIADFEEQAYISVGPGFRFTFITDGELCVERKKMGKRTLQQTIEVRKKFPKLQWVHLNAEILLSKNNGYIKLWQDNELILEHYKIATLPKDFLYSIQGTAGILRQLEVGISANASEQEADVYVDDVEIKYK